MRYSQTTIDAQPIQIHAMQQSKYTFSLYAQIHKYLDKHQYNKAIYAYIYNANDVLLN